MTRPGDGGERFDRMGERLRQPVLEGGGQRRDAGLLGGDRSQRRGDRRLPVRLLLQRSYMHGNCD